jgi:hypothetical protein
MTLISQAFFFDGKDPLKNMGSIHITLSKMFAYKRNKEELTAIGKTMSNCL